MYVYIGDDSILCVFIMMIGLLLQCSHVVMQCHMTAFVSGLFSNTLTITR